MKLVVLKIHYSRVAHEPPVQVPPTKCDAKSEKLEKVNRRKRCFVEKALLQGITFERILFSDLEDPANKKKSKKKRVSV